MKFSVSLLICECSYARKNQGCRSAVFSHIMGDIGHIYVALGVSVDRASATHIKATMTIHSAETCS